MSAGIELLKLYAMFYLKSVREYCTRYPQDAEVFMLIDELGLVPIRRKSLFCELVKERQKFLKKDRDFLSWCLSTRKGLNVRKRSGCIDAVELSGLFGHE